MGSASFGSFTMSSFGPLFFEQLPIKKPMSLSAAAVQLGVTLAVLRTKARQGHYDSCWIDQQMPTPKGRSYTRKVEGVLVSLRGEEKEAVEQINERRLNQCLDLFLDYLALVAEQLHLPGGVRAWKFDVRVIGEAQDLRFHSGYLNGDCRWVRCECLPGRSKAVIHLDVRFFLVREIEQRTLIVYALQECFVCSLKAYLHQVDLSSADAAAINMRCVELTAELAQSRIYGVSLPTHEVIESIKGRPLQIGWFGE